MATLPQLIEEDIERLNAALAEFLTQADATAALVLDKGGFLIASQGSEENLDFTTIGALASGAFLANQTIAGLVNETNFNCVYQQGEKISMVVSNIDEHCLLCVIFDSKSGVGVVKYFASIAIGRIAAQLVVAGARAPGNGLDLSELNMANPQELFRRKAA
jgi:predicted regulator of Ras-like GTPase activity (Roadblock/LC7/MglB family)